MATIASLIVDIAANTSQLVKGVEDVQGQFTSLAEQASTLGEALVGAFAIIGDIIPPRDRGKYQGYMGGVFAFSSVVGPLIGGFLTDQVSWRWVFYVNLPVGIAALFVVAANEPVILAAAVKRSFGVVAA